MKRLLLFMVFAVSVLIASAQTNPWKRVDLFSASKGKDFFKNRFKPDNFITFQLDENVMKKELSKAPSERKVSSSNSSFVISLPNPSGRMERFRVVEAPSMVPELAARFPDIKSYAGQGIDHPDSRIRFDMSPMGFNATVLSASRSSYYINWIDRASKTYMVYERNLKEDKKYGFDCELDETLNKNVQLSGVSTAKNANTGVLRTFRLALCITGEYSRAVLADVAPGTDTSTTAKKKAIILAIMNTNTTAANAIFENEFNARLQLIATVDNVIYLDPATDPFDTWTASFNTTTWNTQTQNTCTSVIGTANYDVGHMLNYNPAKNNGNAGCIGCVCKSPSGTTGKGRGWNMYGQYQGSYLIVDYWTHELGHQFGANHTFTHSIESTIAQVEPGSGSTIMGYAGITGATDLQMHSDAYYHAISLQQVTDYIQTGTGATCGTTSSIVDNRPTVNAGSDYTIPKSTPYKLTGSATDADAGDVLTYCWEQMDAYGTSTNSNTYPTSTTTKGPIARSFSPVTDNFRMFPRLEVILDSNNVGKWEVLPSVARTLNYRLTVRDNHPGDGSNESDDMVVTVSSAAGPFLVTAPNTAVNWGAGTQQTVTWSVNNTNAAPINCANVKISLSTDNGQTFPYVLAASTTNNGTATVTIPAGISSSNCRVKVEAIGNIFFDISNTKFSIGSCGDVSGLTAGSITGTSASLSWAAGNNANSYTVDYKPASGSAWTNLTTTTTSTNINVTGLTPGTLYDYRVKNNCVYNNGNYISAQFTTLCNVAPSGLTAGSITGTAATLSWTASSGGANYDVDYKLTSSSTWINAATATTNTSVDISSLTPGSSYDFRVRANCSVGSTTYTNSSFNTLCNVAPSGLTAGSITGTAATLSWTASPGGANYDVDYKLTSSSTWINAATATTSTSVNINSLTPGSSYDFRVRANCSVGSTTYTNSSFNTLCNVAPSGLTAGSITGTAATLSWTASSGGANYDVDYKLTSSSTWINAVTATTSTSVNINSLTPGSSYDFRVRANCSVGSTTYTASSFNTACDIAPTGLSVGSIGTSSAILSWNISSDAISYDVVYKESTSSTWIPVATGTTSTSVNLNSLNYSTTYDVRVRSNCSVGSSSFSVDHFTTATPACDAPAGIEAGSVTTSSATISWSAVGSAASYDVDYKAAASSTWINAASGITSTSVDLGGLDYSTAYDIRVRTNCIYGNTSDYTTGSFTTATPACDAPAGIEAGSVTTSSATISWSAVGSAASYDVDYKAAASSTWINAASGITSTSADLGGLDYSTAYDIRVRTNCIYGNTSDYTTGSFTTATPACDAPAGIEAGSVTTSSATISWTAVGSAASYDVDYKAASSSTWINAASGITSISVDLGGLDYSTAYDIRVRTNCIYGNTSDYTTGSFTTATPACDAPAGIEAGSVTTSSATISWTAVGSAASYDVDYKAASSSTWINAANGITSTSVDLDGLDYSTAYDIRVRTNCIYGNTSDYTSAQFTTSVPDCAAPGGLTSSNVTPYTATISWTAVGSAASYDVDYKAASSSTWINAASGITSTSVGLNGLDYNTQYDWRVRTNCVSGYSSAYTSAQFTTTTPPCELPARLNVTGIYSDRATLRWAPLASASSYDVMYRVSGNPSFTTLATGITDSTYNLTGLDVGTSYDWKLVVNCKYGGNFEAVSSFSTGSCDRPVSLIQTNVLYNGATIQWNPVVGATGYDVSYKEHTASNWITAGDNIADTFAVLSGLTQQTQYDWRVRVRCDQGYGKYALKYLTTASQPICPGIYDTAYNDLIGKPSRITLNKIVHATLSSASDVDYFVYTTTASSTTVTVNVTGLPLNCTVQLLDPGGIVTATGVSNGVSPIQMTYNVGASPRNYIKISGAPGSYTDMCYILTTSTLSAAKYAENISSSQKTEVSQLYPNPAFNKINLKVQKITEGSVIKIADVYGRSLMQFKTSNPVNTLDVSSLKAGAYFITVMSKDGEVLYNSRFIKY